MGTTLEIHFKGFLHTHFEDIIDRCEHAKNYLLMVMMKAYRDFLGDTTNGKSKHKKFEKLVKAQMLGHSLDDVEMEG